MRKLPIKIAIVEYYNTEPILHGLSMAPVGFFDISRAIPAECAAMYKAGKVDLALMPLASFFKEEESIIIGNYGICCQKAVRSVALFANEELAKISHVILDSHSRSSVQLLKLLMKNHFKKEVSYEVGEVSDIALREGTAVLMIGDKVFHNEHRFKYCHDLGTAWYDYKKLPFVFAVWAGKKGIDQETIDLLDSYVAKGLEVLPDKVDDWSKKYKLDLRAYYEENITYHIGGSERAAIAAFKEEISRL